MVQEYGLAGWRGEGIQNLHMTRETRDAGYLCECGFISNLDQELLLKTSEVTDPHCQGNSRRYLRNSLDSEAGSPKPSSGNWTLWKSLSAGIDKNRHNAEDAAPKWFVPRWP